MMKVFEIAGSGLVAQSQRLNVVASNIANAESAAGPNGKVYQARHVIFQATSPAELPTRSGSVPGAATAGLSLSTADQSMGVRVSGIVENQAPGKKVFDPKHPLADSEGFVSMPNVDFAEEMVDMISASRSYQMNAEVMNTAKNLMLKTLSLGS